MNAQKTQVTNRTLRKATLNVFALFLPEIRDLLENRNFQELKNLLKGMHSIDIAEGWSLLEPSEKLLIFKLLSFKRAVEVFENLRFEEQSFLLENLDNSEIASILNEMASDERAHLFKDLPEKIIKKLFSLMRKEEVDDVRKLLTFEEDTAGSLMATEFVILKKDFTARKAILRVQESYKAGQTRNIYSVFVVDDEYHLIGGLSLQDLITAPPDMLLKDLISDTELIKINVNSPKEEVAIQFSRYNLLDAPVVNDSNQLVGVITIDDVVDLIQRQTTTEIYEIGKMGAGGGEEIRYQTASVGELVRRRAGWLVVLLIIDFLTGKVLKFYEGSLTAVVALTFFIPMLLDTGGNAGNQAAITIIRGLATGDVNFKNIWRIARLEIMAALIMALIVGVVAFIRALLLQGDITLAFVVGFTMGFIVILAILTGVCLPLLSKKLGLDPAVLAGPITTSVIDIVGLLIYFKIAQFLIPALR